MQTNELYRRYLLATRFAQIAERIEAKLRKVEFGDAGNYWRQPENIGYVGYVSDVHPYFDTYNLEPEERERVADQLLEALPELALTRSEGELRIAGLVQGLRVEVYLGKGVCELVKVGTRTVPEQPAKEAVPEHEEDVFEWRCPDPIVAAGIQ